MGWGGKSLGLEREDASDWVEQQRWPKREGLVGAIDRGPPFTTAAERRESEVEAGGG